MNHLPTLSVYAVVPTGATAEITTVGGDTVTVHPTGVLCQPSLHFVSLEQLEDWSLALRRSIIALRLERADVAKHQAEAHEALVKAGAR